MNSQFNLKCISLFFVSRCNLRCAHCGYGFAEIARSAELPAAFFVNVLKEAREIGAENINITGGEVFIRNDSFEMIEGAIALGYRVTIESNGLLLNEKYTDRLSLLC